MSDIRLWEQLISQDVSEWRNCSLGEIFSNRQETNRGDLPLLSVTANAGIVDRDTIERRDTSNSDKGKYLFVQRGDIAYNTMRMWQGVSGLARKDGIVSPAYTVLQPKPNVVSEFAAYLLKHPLLVQKFHQFSQGLVDDTLNLKYPQFSAITVKLPPLAEQKKIAEILSSVDEVIENTECEISKLEDFKKATLNELLTKGIGHTEFKETEIGRIPKSWEVVSIDSIVGPMESGVSVNSEDRVASSNEIGILKTSCVSNGEFFPHENKVVLGKDIDRVQTAVTKNTIIVSRMNTPLLVGESGFVDHSIHTIFLPDRLWSLSISDESKYSVKWLSAVLSSTQIRDEIRRRATGTSGSMKNISKPNFLGILIPSPSLREQEMIGDIARVFESRIANKKRRRLTVQRMKAALMQDLLTGKVRVKVN